jgi:sugar phosphate isomerase/epimerase
MNLEEDDSFAAIRRTKGRLVGFHVADNNRFAPGMGTFDWPRIVETLREIGYDGPLSVEFCPTHDRTPATRFPGSIDTRPEGLSAEQLKFLEDHGSSAFTEEFYSMLTQRSADTLLPLIR